MFEVEKNNGGWCNRNDDNNIARELLKTIDDYRYCVFVCLLRFYFVERGCKNNTARQRKFCLPKSTHVSCCRTPTLTDKRRNGTVVFDDIERRTVQREVIA